VRNLPKFDHVTKKYGLGHGNLQKSYWYLLKNKKHQHPSSILNHLDPPPISRSDSPLVLALQVSRPRGVSPGDVWTISHEDF
jgi:hypothetical protein